MPNWTHDDLAKLFMRHRYAYANEAELQERLAELLRQHDVAFDREFRLSAADRPDFMVGSTAIEVKIKGTINEVLTQLHRYAQHASIDAIVLVTSKARHRKMPAQLNGKPLVIADLLEGSF